MFFFAIAELKSCADTIKLIKDEIHGIPFLVRLPPTTESSNNEFKYSGNDVYVLTENSDVYSVAQYIYQTTKVRVNRFMDRPQDTKKLLIVTLLLLVVVTIVIGGKNQLLSKIPNLIFAGCCAVYYIVISGVIYNSINNPMWMHVDQRGVWWYMPSTRSHFQVEGYIMGVFHLIIAFGIILINHWIPKIKSEKLFRSMGILIIFVTLSAFLFVMNIYKLKSPYYPYAMTFKFIK